jgi:3-hydroxybutyryl-CoA dehydratase
MSDLLEAPLAPAGAALHVGATASRAKTIRRQDIAGFAELSGDRNPLHLDEAFARATPFGGCIAHGMLAGALISAVLGNDLPGPGAVYLAQNLRFRAPVRPGDRVVARVTVAAVEGRRVRLDTVCTVDGKPVVDGEATLLMPKAG